MDIKEIKSNRFDGGKALDKRLALSNECAKCLNFDIRKFPSRLTPVRAYEDDEAYNNVAEGIKASDLACFGQTGTANVYAIGRKNDGTGRKIYNKGITASTWLESTSSNGNAAETSAGCAVPGFFIQQKNSSGSSLYWFVTGSGETPSSGFWMLGLMDFTTSAGVEFSKKTLAFNPTFYPQAVVGADGVVYVSDRNKIHACNPTKVIEDSVFTVSAEYNITSMCVYGTYLAIAIYANGKSKVLLWDYNSAQATDTIDWGEGALMVLENLDGILVGVTDRYINSTLFGASASGNGSMEIKTWAGVLDTPIKVEASGSVARAIEQFKYVKDGILQWYAKIPLADGTYEEGIWTFGRQTSDQPYSLSLERQVAGTFEGFWGAGDYLYMPHSGDGSVSRTASTDIFTLTSTYEVFADGGDSTVEKNSLGFSLGFEKLTSGQTLVVKYRIDGATNWTTLEPAITPAEDALSAIYPDAFNFREVEFRIESTGGAKPVSWRFRYEELSDLNDGG